MPLDERAAEEFYVRAFVEPSLDVTGILGGKPGLRNTTLVSHATAGVTIRVAPGQDAEVVAAAAERLLRDALPAGARLEVETDVTQPAVLPRDTAELEPRAPPSDSVFGREPLIVRAGGTLPVLAALARRGIPTVMAGLALPGQPHALAERADAARDVPARSRRRARDVSSARRPPR